MHTSCDITSGYHKIEVLTSEFMCGIEDEKSLQGIDLLFIKRPLSVSSFTAISLELYNIAKADKHSSQLRLKQ